MRVGVGLNVAEGPLDGSYGVAEDTEGSIACVAEQATDRAAMTLLLRVVMVDGHSQTRDTLCCTAEQCMKSTARVQVYHSSSFLNAFFFR